MLSLAPSPPIQLPAIAWEAQVLVPATHLGDLDGTIPRCCGYLWSQSANKNSFTFKQLKFLEN